MSNFPRGSEWRRWELHIHTPFTRKGDCFTGSTEAEKWGNFFESILEYIGEMDDPLKAIYALGITDYFSIENYKNVIQNHDITKKIPLILPNIELRILLQQESTYKSSCYF